MNKKHLIPLLCCLPLALFGCGKPESIVPQDSHTEPDSFASMYWNTTDTYHCYKSLNNQTEVLDYETMQVSSLCSKPNCNHNDLDCIVRRLNGNIPMLSGTNAYYFSDDGARIQEGEDGKPFLKLGSTLYRFDLATNMEEKLLHIDGMSVSYNCYGWLLHDGSVYFIGNQYGRKTDENGILTGWRNTGGEMALYSVDLATQEITNYCDLYDLSALTKYYPDAPNSGEVYMKGIFDNKIYFNVAFVEMGEDHMATYLHYVTYFDLGTKTYHGEPEDYANIDFGSVAFASEDYLVICADKSASVYLRGEAEPLVFRDDAFNDYAKISVFDDVLFFYDKAYMLKTGEVRTVERLANKQIVAKYGDSYIVSDEGMQTGFEKIPVSELLPV